MDELERLLPDLRWVQALSVLRRGQGPSLGPGQPLGAYGVKLGSSASRTRDCTCSRFAELTARCTFFTFFMDVGLTLSVEV
jgi:hypothetical protein